MPRRVRRLPIAPLLTHAGWRDGGDVTIEQLAQRFGTTRRAVARFLADGTLPEQSADQICARLDVHMLNIWPNYYELFAPEPMPAMTYWPDADGVRRLVTS